MTEQTNAYGLDEARTAAVNGAADFLEGVARLKQAGQRWLPKPASKAHQGDLLFALVRLHADYLKRLGELGRVQRDLATRTLEHVYASLAPQLPDHGPIELTFGGKTALWQRQFTLENSFDPALSELSIECGPFQGPQPSRPYKAEHAVFECEGHTLYGSGQLTIGYRKPLTVALWLDPNDFAGETVYRAEVRVRLAHRVRCIAVTVDTRRGAL
jgi:hypothetical protein